MDFLKSKLKSKNKAMLAPMHEITNVAFRILCRQFGAGLTYTPLVSAKSIVQQGKCVPPIDTVEDEKPVVIQLFGDKADDLQKAVDIVNARCDAVDLNLGCPSLKITNVECGAAMLDNPKKIKQVVSAMCESKFPITCKMRSGMKKENAMKVAHAIEAGGACALAVHPRLQSQGYSGKSDWNIIKKIKKESSIPIIGNGDIRSAQDAKKMFDETNCDYIMVGRAAMGNPHIFTQINLYLETGEIIPDQNKEEKIVTLLKYFELLKKYKVDSMDVMKQSTQYFSSGMKHSAQFRNAISMVKTKKELLEKINEFLG